jgi:hypothetical protein
MSASLLQLSLQEGMNYCTYTVIDMQILFWNLPWQLTPYGLVVYHVNRDNKLLLRSSTCLTRCMVILLHSISEWGSHWFWWFGTPMHWRIELLLNRSKTTCDGALHEMWHLSQVTTSVCFARVTATMLTLFSVGGPSIQVKRNYVPPKPSQFSLLNQWTTIRSCVVGLFAIVAKLFCICTLQLWYV